MSQKKKKKPAVIMKGKIKDAICRFILKVICANSSDSFNL